MTETNTNCHFDPTAEGSAVKERAKQAYTRIAAISNACMVRDVIAVLPWAYGCSGASASVIGRLAWYAYDAQKAGYELMEISDLDKGRLLSAVQFERPKNSYRMATDDRYYSEWL